MFRGATAADGVFLTHPCTSRGTWPAPCVADQKMDPKVANPVEGIGILNGILPKLRQWQS